VVNICLKNATQCKSSFYILTSSKSGMMDNMRLLQAHLTFTPNIYPLTSDGPMDRMMEIWMLFSASHWNKKTENNQYRAVSMPYETDSWLGEQTWFKERYLKTGDNKKDLAPCRSTRQGVSIGSRVSTSLGKSGTDMLRKSSCQVHLLRRFRGKKVLTHSGNPERIWRLIDPNNLESWKPHKILTHEIRKSVWLWSSSEVGR